MSVANKMWFYLYLLGGVTAAKILEECSISPNGDLPTPQPLLLSSSVTLLYPNNRLNKSPWGNIKLYKGDEFELACPGSTFSDSKNDVVTATCVRGKTVKVGKTEVSLESLKCSKTPHATARWTSTTCAGGDHKYIEIGYEIDKDFIRLIRVCFDDNEKVALYSEHVEEPSIYAYQRSYPRVEFEQGSFYDGVVKKVNSVYSINKQRERISSILGSSTLGSKYVSGFNNGYFLARGHLSAKADFVYGTMQSATFFYVNVVPQWQLFNAGNWAALEDSVRTFVSNYQAPVTVYTGTYGVATLPDVNGEEKELFLSEDKNGNGILPVPKLMWKLLYSERDQAGIVFIGVNNPHLTEITNDYLICQDICDQVSWLTWNQDNIKKGYSYCCEVNDFSKTVNTLPTLNVESVLK